MTTALQSIEGSQIELVDRTCAVCGGTKAILAFDQPTENIIGVDDIGYHHLIRVCDGCGFAYASPLLPENLILKYYEHMSNYEHPESSGVRPAADLRQIERQVEIIGSRFPKGFKGSALDVGCSIAYGLSLLQEQGWSVLGLDPSDSCIRMSKTKLNVEVEKGFFSAERLTARAPFDLIIMSHVLEHVVHPDRMISDAHRLLSDRGLVYVEVPNLMKPNGTKCYFGFEHVNFFTPTSLTNLVEQNGFEVDSLTTYDNGKAIHPFYPVIALTIRKSARRFDLVSDKANSMKVIEDYTTTSQALLKKINARIQVAVEGTAAGRLALWGGRYPYQPTSVRGFAEAVKHTLHL